MVRVQEGLDTGGPAPYRPDGRMGCGGRKGEWGEGSLEGVKGGWV